MTSYENLISIPKGQLSKAKTSFSGCPRYEKLAVLNQLRVMQECQLWDALSMIGRLELGSPGATF